MFTHYSNIEKTSLYPIVNIQQFASIHDDEGVILRILLEGYKNEETVELYKDGIWLVSNLNFYQCYAIRVAIKRCLLSGKFHFKWNDEHININQEGQIDNYPDGLWNQFDVLMKKLI